jgi:hypothetical protein
MSRINAALLSCLAILVVSAISSSAAFALWTEGEECKGSGIPTISITKQKAVYY